MERYIGLDVHSTTCTAAVISPTGKLLKATVIETCARALIDFLRSMPRAILVMEEGNQSDWLYEVLWAFTSDILVVQARRSSGNKNDRMDAERLARDAHRNEPGTL